MKPFTPDIDQQETVISIRALYKSFGSNHVLRGIDLDLHKGENIVVLGRSGTGKSVLIKVIVGLLYPDAGTISVLGQEIPELDTLALRDLRLKVGFCFQHGALYDSMTVGENLAFPLRRNEPGMNRKERDRRIEMVLEAIGLSNTINQMPAELSGGQRKRIGIGRTLILRPAIMLYDEPTAGLDPITCTEINDLINEVQHRFKTSSIIITHDLTCAKSTGDTIAVLKEGRFIRQGNFNDVFNSDEELIREFYEYNFIQLHMKKADSRRAATVGIFIVLGLIIFATAILVLGRQQKSFIQSVQVKAVFHDVGGLTKGNNVWFSGVKVGTVKKISFIDQSRIEVLMNIDKNARPFIHKDVRARVGAEGLVGNKIIALAGGTAQTAPVEDGDVITVETSISTDEIMDTLQVNNKNLVTITSHLKVIMGNIAAGQGTLGKLVNDPSVYKQLEGTMTTLQQTADNTQRLTDNLAVYAAKLQKPGVLANDLVSDTIVFSKLRNTATRLQEVATQANRVVQDLQSVSAGVSDRLNSDQSPAGVLLHDSTTARQLQQTIRNLESSTDKLDENMEALKHNFLFKGYFRRQEKQRKKEEKQQQKELQNQ